MSIIRDPLYISEDYRLNEALIDFEDDLLRSNLEKIKQSAVVAVVGDYGTGKSTALYGIRQSDNDTSHKWLMFDAWRYPERKGLWDGLVIEIAKQLGQEGKATRKVDGNQSVFGKWGGIISETFSQFSGLLPKVEINKIEMDPAITEKAAKVTQKAEEIFGRSPVKRVYELERILADILVGIKQEVIYLVVEDVDRSGVDGLNFLETLNFFIKNNPQIKESEKKIIVIAPIATINYKDSKDSYYKCVDVAFEFAPKVKTAKRFIEQVFTDEALGSNGLSGEFGNGHPYLNNIEIFIKGLFEDAKYGMNIRKLKAIIRQTDIRFKTLSERYDNVDWRAVLVFEAMKNITETSDPNMSMYENRVVKNSRLSERNIFTGLLMTIHSPERPIYTYRYANTRLPEDRLFSDRIQRYEFLDYKERAHGKTSVWVSLSRDGFQETGYIAEFYRS